ncbi:putative reverse transcriptase domain-containing protein [Tanacetum coccineum]
MQECMPQRLPRIQALSRSKEEHEVHLKLVLESLRKEKLYAKLSKCKIEAVKNWKAPTTSSEIRSFLGLAANVVADALSRKERVKPKYVWEMAMTIQSEVKGMILAAQGEAFNQENVFAERLHGVDQQMERKVEGSLYFMDRIWVPLVGGMRIVITDKAYKSRYSVHPRVDKMYYDLRDMYWWPGIRGILLPMLAKALGTRLDMSTDYHPQIDGQSECIIQKLEDMLRACVIDFGGSSDVHLTKGKLSPRYVGPFEILERIDPIAYRLHVPLDEIKVDKTLRFVEEPVEIMDHKIKNLKWSKISLVKVRWNSNRGPEFTWEREYYMKSKYPQLFIDRADESAS